MASGFAKQEIKRFMDQEIARVCKHCGVSYVQRRGDPVCHNCGLAPSDRVRKEKYDSIKGFEQGLANALLDYARDRGGYEYSLEGENIVLRSCHDNLDMAYVSMCVLLSREFLNVPRKKSVRVFIKAMPKITKTEKGYEIETRFRIGTSTKTERRTNDPKGL